MVCRVRLVVVNWMVRRGDDMEVFFCFKQKRAYEMRISDWSSDVCSSDLLLVERGAGDEHDGEDRAEGERMAQVGRVAEVRHLALRAFQEIGRASCWDRRCQYV